MRLEECGLPDEPSSTGRKRLNSWCRIVANDRASESGERLCLHRLYSRELKLSIKKSSRNIGLESKQRRRVILSKCS